MNINEIPPVNLPSDEEYMQKCIALAKEAASLDEVPVGALVICRGEIVGMAYNTREQSKCATHHA